MHTDTRKGLTGCKVSLVMRVAFTSSSFLSFPSYASILTLYVGSEAGPVVVEVSSSGFALHAPIRECSALEHTWQFANGWATSRFHKYHARMPHPTTGCVPGVQLSGLA